MKQVSELKEQDQNLKARAVARYIRISPRKMRIVLDEIRYKPVHEAFSILANTKKKAARIAIKTLKSAVANAKQKQMDENRLIVRLAFADGGPSLKRFLPRAMGRADDILKRTSHLTMVVSEDARRPSKAGGASASHGKSSKWVKNKTEKKKEAAGAI